MELAKPKPDFKQGEIWVVDLGEPYPTGREFGFPHSCVILQTDIMNDRMWSVIVAPFVKPGHWSSKNPLFAVLVEPSSNNQLDQSRYIDISSMRSLSVDRLVDRQGVLDPDDFKRLAFAFYATFGDILLGDEE